MKNKCTHSERIEDTVFRTEWCHLAEDFREVEYRDSYEKSTFKDIDLHRMKCTKCGAIDYYSKAAKDFYEKGIKSKGIKGLC